ncbi:unnamed protein product, partial [Prorocentrum cordatum]
MVKVEAKNNPKGVRSFMESIAEAAEGTIEGSRNRLKVQVRAECVGDRLTGKEARAQVTMTYYASTGNITIHTPAAIEDRIFHRVNVLESLYQMALAQEQVPPAPEGGSLVVNSCRLPAWDQFTSDADGSKIQGSGGQASGQSGVDQPLRTLRLPKETGFHNVVGDIGLCVSDSLASFPLRRDKVLRYLVEERGLQAEMLDNDHPENLHDPFDRAPKIKMNTLTDDDQSMGRSPFLCCSGHDGRHGPRSRPPP